MNLSDWQLLHVRFDTLFLHFYREYWLFSSYGMTEHMQEE